MDLKNKTKRPIRVPLPGGKKLHLGPGKTGQITPKALDHPPLAKLIEAGDVEVEGGRDDLPGGGGGGGGGDKAAGPSQGHSSSGGVRHTGDR